jgi:hypothetical protein
MMFSLIFALALVETVQVWCQPVAGRFYLAQGVGKPSKITTEV